MELCQNLAELAQTKVDDINCGEVLSTSMLLGEMLCSAGKELKEACKHLLKCSGDIKEGHLRNIPRNHLCKSRAPPVQVNFTKTVNTLDPKVMQSLRNVCVDLSYTCYLCKKSFKFEGQLNDHLNAHIILQYPCHKCTKVSKSKHEHVKHLKTHENNYCCALCGKNFLLCTSLYNHLKIHAVDHYYCQHEDCEFSTQSKSRFNEH